MTNSPKVVGSYIEVPNLPGIGVDIDEEAIAKYPSTGNINMPDMAHDFLYVYHRHAKARWLDPTALNVGGQKTDATFPRPWLGTSAKM
eukprot:SAG11_NODE_5038_length_1683_cov_1.448864_2_plen_88_part_00